MVESIIVLNDLSVLHDSRLPEIEGVKHVRELSLVTSTFPFDTPLNRLLNYLPEACALNVLRHPPLLEVPPEDHPSVEVSGLVLGQGVRVHAQQSL